MTVLAGAKVALPGEAVDPGWVAIEGDRIADAGWGTPEHVDHDLSGYTIVPGFVDVHCHGGGGASFDSADADECRTAADFHLRHGTTTLVASLVTDDLAAMHRRAAVLAELTEDGTLAGIHLEGPFLSPQRCGAHDPRVLRSPDPEAVDGLLTAGRGHVRMMTIAPELDGGVAAVRRVADAGVLAAVGHTDATYDVTLEAIEAGARVATHLFNGMRPLHHRTPGPILALLDDPRVTCELIADDAHLHPSIVYHVAKVAGVGRAALVTDAMAAAGMTDGTYRVGGLDVRVTDGVARLADGGSIAGSTGTTDAAFRRTVLEVGVPLPHAVRLAATTPARLLGLDDRGAIAPGMRADLVVLDDDLSVHTVITAGEWITTH